METYNKIYYYKMYIHLKKFQFKLKKQQINTEKSISSTRNTKKLLIIATYL